MAVSHDRIEITASVIGVLVFRGMAHGCAPAIASRSLVPWAADAQFTGLESNNMKNGIISGDSLSLTP